jgi:hypothetical protein
MPAFLAVSNIFRFQTVNILLGTNFGGGKCSVVYIICCDRGAFSFHATMCARTLADRLASSEDVAPPTSPFEIKPTIKRRFIRRTSSEDIAPESLTKQDTIAVITAYTKNVADLAYAVIDQLQHTRAYT